MHYTETHKIYSLLNGHYCLLISFFQLKKNTYPPTCSHCSSNAHKDLGAQQNCPGVAFSTYLGRVSFPRSRQLLYPFLSLCNFVFFQNIVNYCVALPKANSTSILLFLTAVFALRINKYIRISFNRYPIEFPMEVFLVGVLMPPVHGSDNLKYLL